MRVDIAHRDDWSYLLDFDDSSMTFRERIVALEAKLMAMPQVDVRIEHQFVEGLYARTMYAPKGILIVSRLYKVPQINIISVGDVSYRSEHGGGRFHGPHIFEAPSSSKRAIYCHTDTVWTTMLPSSSSDIRQNEDHVYAATYEDLDDDIIVIGG